MLASQLTHAVWQALHEERLRDAERERVARSVRTAGRRALHRGRMLGGWLVSEPPAAAGSAPRRPAALVPQPPGASDRLVDRVPGRCAAPGPCGC
jgi:hypothetical protein